VTVFAFVRHAAGTVVSGWNFRDGSGGVPVHQFCYYTAPNPDHSSIRVDIASNRVPSSIDAGLVPDLNTALTKCQWWNESPKTVAVPSATSAPIRQPPAPGATRDACDMFPTLC
jgi:hypothetical protein